MTKQNQFEKTLNSSYNHTDFISFINEFLSGNSDPNCGIKSIAPDFYQEERSNFSYYVDGYYHIGYYNSEDNQKILLLSVCLRKGETVERARSMQRNFVKKLIENSNCVGALVAFYTKNEPDKWRFSFIRLDYEFSKGKITEKLTPARRYSYLVGKGEPSATALQRLFPIYENDFDCVTLDQLEEAFSVEKVTNEFYNQYKEKYLELKEYLDTNKDFVKESTERGFTSEEFSKKLLGQIIFLYFLQKKGWLGVNSFPVTLTKKEYDFAFWARTDKRLKDLMPKAYRETENGDYERNSKVLDSLSSEEKEIIASVVKGGDWGTGPRNFMRAIYNDSIKKGKNFFDDCLEELFYTGLNKNRGENCFYAPLCCRIPFLNGGLFEELENYDWRNNHFNIPNEFFSNVDKKGRDADGLLDIFDRYNFTMNEDEPMEREVAIDPEMLGKVFENLLDVRDRKSKGAFYTPREIVHYMCQETLINYLSTKTGISEEAIRNFILYGEYFRDSDTVKTKKIEGSKYPVIDKERDLLISDEIFSFKKGVNRLKELDDLLANVKVADLAVGSGAFPVGVLNEIVKARNVLTEYLSIEMNYGEKRHFLLDGRRSYDLKINTIKNCIFACDIEPSAVEIAKLRLWLSIVIDDILTKADEADEQFSEHSKPRPLPNLDCNIICGNSLVDEFQGVKLISQSDLLNNMQKGHQFDMFQSGVDDLIRDLIKFQDKLFFEDNHEEKEQLKQKIQEIYNNIIYEQIKSDPKLTESYFEVIKQHSMPFVLWQLYFPKVFKENGGFDIVIGNPPYGAKISANDKKIYQRIFKATKTIKKKKKGSTDTFALFIEQGFNLTSKSGIVNLIVPMSVISSDSMTALHNLIESQCEKIFVASFAERPKQIFDSACVKTSIILLKKTGTPLRNLYTTKLVKRTSDDIQEIINNLQFVDSFEYKIFGRYPKIGTEFERDILKKLFLTGKKLENYRVLNSEHKIYYRSSGGRYYKVITPYSTGSSKEVGFPVSIKNLKILSAILGTSLFWFYQQAYTDCLDLKQSEISSFPVPNLEKIEPSKLQNLISAYDEYLQDIEKNVIVHKSSSYNVDSFKEYKIQKSKKYIDRLDDLVGEMYNLTKEQVDFIKNFEINVRISE